jgi:DNA-directed RNA polymerase subunit M/transcription elongation factor TFIIS
MNKCSRCGADLTTGDCPNCGQLVIYSDMNGNEIGRGFLTGRVEKDHEHIWQKTLWEMNKREVKPEERPLCPRCKKPLSWVLTKTYYEEVYGWEYDCDCIDTARLKADEVFKFTP